jgi:hypothetical protein
VRAFIDRMSAKYESFFGKNINDLTTLTSLVLVIDLDDKMRGTIEHNIESQLEQGILEDFGWAFDTISSKKDYLLGCTVGKLMALAWTTFREKEYDPTYYDLEQVRDMIRRRLPEIQRKIATELNR